MKADKNEDWLHMKFLEVHQETDLKCLVYFSVRISPNQLYLRDDLYFSNLIFLFTLPFPYKHLMRERFKDKQPINT